jgi:photosystem II stability/assembly factor-like uncharacterized protein
MARARALIGFGAILALVGFAPRSRAPENRSPSSPPGAVLAVALERRGYRIADSPSAGAVHVATDEGLFRSETGDGEWVRAAGLPEGPVTALAIFQREHPVEEPIVAHRTWVEYATVIYAGARTGLFRSTDLGQTWEPAGTGLPPTPLRSLLAERDGAVLALTEEGEIFRSANAGARWSRVGATLQHPVRALSLDASGNGSLWASAGRGLFRSADGGRSWVRLATPSAEPAGFVASSVAAGHGLAIVAGESVLLPGVDHPLAFTSSDHGVTWTRLPQSVDGPLVIEPGESPRVYAAAKGLALATRDGGETWARVGDSATPFAAVLAVDPDWPGRVYGRTPGGALARVSARCESGPAALCLRDGRFRVEIEWNNPEHEALASKEAAVSAAAAREGREDDDRGAFWLSRPSNVLLTVQIRDARRMNGHFWIDVDAKTIRGFSLIVTDMATGMSTRYSHPEGQRTKFTDHEAF